ncbi:unnamed protein product [Arabis nemorensis]|uniref:TPX2 C-terminal domain-containing protein n=1 Tax=Arabis nemorensis TaxID=586526 RepID=A0A565AYL2_9BRAS|nr:unnamed protein product [Arabis nemorensis]
MGREPVDKHMDKKSNSFTESSDDKKVQGPSTIEAAEVKECTEVASDAHRRQQGINDTPRSLTSSDSKKKLNSSSRGSRNHTVPKPFSLSAEKPPSSVSGNAASHNSSSASRASQLNSPLPARKTTDHEKHHYDEDSFSVASSSATSIRTIKPKITVGVAPTFRSTARLERRKEEEQELVTKQLRKNMAYKANPVPNFYYEAPPPKLPLKKFPLTRPKSPNLNRRKSCSDSSYQEVKGKHGVGHRHSVDGCKEEPKANNGPRTPNMRKSSKETSKSEQVYGKNKSGHENENGIDLVE